jgi:hypothetical protein
MCGAVSNPTVRDGVPLWPGSAVLCTAAPDPSCRTWHGSRVCFANRWCPALGASLPTLCVWGGGVGQIVNSQRMQTQVKNVVPSIAVDKTDGCIIYLSFASRGAQIVTSKCSEVNVSFPSSDSEDADWVRCACAWVCFAFCTSLTLLPFGRMGAAPRHNALGWGGVDAAPVCWVGHRVPCPSSASPKAVPRGVRECLG